jgi:hypothetical protein
MGWEEKRREENRRDEKRFRITICNYLSSLSLARLVLPLPIYPSAYNQAANIWGRVQNMKVFISILFSFAYSQMFLSIQFPINSIKQKIK